MTTVLAFLIVAPIQASFIIILFEKIFFFVYKIGTCSDKQTNIHNWKCLSTVIIDCLQCDFGITHC